MRDGVVQLERSDEVNLLLVGRRSHVSFDGLGSNEADRLYFSFLCRRCAASDGYVQWVGDDDGA